MFHFLLAFNELTCHVHRCTYRKNQTTITNSDLNRPCFAWHPYGKSDLFKTELVIIDLLQMVARKTCILY